MKKILTSIFLLVLPILVHSQGEDSTKFERDEMIISEFLPGLYSNYNQVYFNNRGKVPDEERHGRREIEIKEIETNIFSVSDTFINANIFEKTITKEDKEISHAIIVVEANNIEKAVQLNIYKSDEEFSIDDLDIKPDCSVMMIRGAEEFYAREYTGQCDELTNVYTLSEKHLFVRMNENSGIKTNVPYKLNQARAFECYVDIPGVSGGRDLPYKRYEPFYIHDQGGTFEIVTDYEKRNLVFRLVRVDWEINNHIGVFTRDVMVLYAEERTDDGYIINGYTFTEPDITRVGINFKWMLVSCFMESNKFATPFM
ncbi:MAG: hypothetical protein L7T25_02335 [Gammaproteobacteria bacterium]|nr:hypothetical protein [Gammaproteobacteria bacterium]|tara:strand:+ start:2001 stop:2939 length:939 start_codon:yes stop_codon:yes gene_type:complete